MVGLGLVWLGWVLFGFAFSELDMRAGARVGRKVREKSNLSRGFFWKENFSFPGSLGPGWFGVLCRCFGEGSWALGTSP